MEKMKILATSQYGWPEPHPSLYPMEEMASRGHFVQAVIGMPNYPMGKIYEGYKRLGISEEDHNGIHIIHVPVVPRKHDPIHRLLNYHTYPISAKRRVLKIKEDFDVIFANQASPIMMVEPAISYAKKNRKKVVMYCMDLWPASLCAGGVSKNSLLYKFYWKISKRIYRDVDLILVSSRLFKDYLISEFDIIPDRIEYLPQYALSEFRCSHSVEEKDTTDFVFAGNVGKAQNLGVVLRAAKIIMDQKINDHGKKIVFHILGEGQELEHLKRYVEIERIDNVVFHGRKPAEEMPQYYAMADAMVVTLVSDFPLSLTLPAKVQSYMAAGKPILACADGEIANVISESGCGYCARANDEEDFVNSIKLFVESKTDRTSLGKRAIEYYYNNFSRKIVMDRLEEILYKYSDKKTVLVERR